MNFRASLLLSLLLPVAAAGFSARAEAGERVRLILFTGEALEGRVYDLHDQYLEIHRTLGSTKVPKSDIESWTLVVDEEPAPTPAAGDAGAGAEPPGEADGTAAKPPEGGKEPGILLVLLGGHEIAGEVRFVPQTLEWVVRLPAGEARYPEKEVARTISPSGITSDGWFTPRAGFDRRIREAVGAARGENSIERERAAEFIEAAGFFAVRELERSLAEEGEHPQIARLLLRERFRVVLPAGIEKSFPNLLRDVSEGLPDSRVEALREALLEAGSDLYPFLGLLLLDARQPAEVRSFSIDVLGRMHRIRELLEAYRVAEGQAQFAIAIALGDNGVYIGIPTLIEALALGGDSVTAESVTASTLALRRLEEYSGEDFGFDPNASAEERAAAVARWEEWWQQNRPTIEESLREWIVEGHESPSRRRAADLWRRGMLARERGQNESAEQFFHEAKSADPTSMAPLVSLGIMAYTYRQDPQAGIDWFRQALSRPEAPGEESLRRLCYFHLGRIYQQANNWEMARQSLAKAVEIDPTFTGAWYEFGKVQFQEALRIPGDDPQRRRSALEDARQTFLDGIAALERAREDQSLIDLNALPYDDDLPFNTREHNRSLREIRERLFVEIGRFHHQCAVISLALQEPRIAKDHIQKAKESPEPDESLTRLEAAVDKLLGGTGRGGQP
jgi:tetratricopeptide (TPR) repeat protein